MTGTPPAWRAAAAASLGGSLALGALVTLYAPLAVPLAAGAALVAYVVPIALATRRPPLPPLGDAAITALGPLPTVSVVVAGRNEADVIPALVADLAAQDHRATDGRPMFELIVVDDRSTDGTGAVALQAARDHGLESVTRVVRRGAAPGSPGDDPPLPDGKGAALTAAPPETCSGEVIAVLDADARIGPSYLRRAASYFARGAPAMTARRRIIAADVGPGWRALLIRMQADELLADAEIQLGRWAQGGCSEFRGNGILVRRDLLAAVGGWHAQALTEDLDLSSRIAATGARVGFALDVEAWEEPVLDPGALLRQRLRWAGGIIRRELELSAPLLRSRHLAPRAKLDYVAYSLQTVTSVALAGAVIAAIPSGRWLPAGLVAGAYVLSGGLLAADAMRWESPPPRAARRILRGAGAVTFSSLWLPMFGVAWARLALGSGTLRYAKTDHLGAPAGWVPAPGPEGAGGGAGSSGSQRR
jgi:cellulose synthase/poly-beta-1,6-N-acetylglucosamine synthase-like glycosyltransferase